MGLANRVTDYFSSLIVGVILLYVLIVMIDALLKDFPQIYQYGLAIIIAAAFALVVLARKGIR